jgi:diaminohydroxyphosphoribosylaminopyrimidine deaminase/5-amino-6-(5-phosphoribosylamino)uracil reductase
MCKINTNEAEMGEYDPKYMQRALELALMAGGNTRPNPLVGAVIVHDDRVIGEGYHARAGEPHAEVVALNRVKDRTLIPESDIYVTLEPCSHHGRTPPCAEMIVREGFRRVIIGTRDTSRKVSGRGIEILKAGGCQVIEGVLENECREVNRRFFIWHEKGRPYIVLKWAVTSDGFFDAERNPEMPKGPNWITGNQERILVHKWRSEEHAVIIGENTLCNDDPLLNVRHWTGMDPVRVVISDSPERLAGYRMFRGEGSPVILFSPGIDGAEEGVEYFRTGDRQSTVEEALKELHRREIQSVMVEGGANLLSQFIGAGLWDEARIFRGYRNFGSGLKAPGLQGRIVQSILFESSRLEIIRPRAENHTLSKNM